MNKIVPSKVLYIKLGQGGEWNENCIEESNCVKIGFVDVDKQLLKNREWSKIKLNYEQKGIPAHIASLYTNQLRVFCETDGKVLWITFYKHKLWWTFAKVDLEITKTNEKVRSCIDKWHDTDINNKTLFTEALSGDLTKVQRFQSTICTVYAENYIVRKINAEESEEVIKTILAKNNLIKAVASIIKILNPYDFELLIDLIFRNFGFQRTSIIGRTQKEKDIELFSPVFNERYLVQIKTASNLKEFIKYAESFTDNLAFDCSFFIVHSPSKDLDMYSSDNDRVILWKVSDISKHVINSGLLDWILDKVV